MLADLADQDGHRGVLGQGEPADMLGRHRRHARKLAPAVNRGLLVGRALALRFHPGGLEARRLDGLRGCIYTAFWCICTAPLGLPGLDPLGEALRRGVVEVPGGVGFPQVMCKVVEV
jgi:hypothetical protein